MCYVMCCLCELIWQCVFDCVDVLRLFCFVVVLRCVVFVVLCLSCMCIYVVCVYVDCHAMWLIVFVM